MNGKDNGRRQLRRLFPTQCARMESLVSMVEKILDHPVSVLITGEPGTGKNLLAEAIHRCSDRARRALVRIDCATLPHDLFESELFGYEKGTFTGAQSRKSGKLELAHGGTVFFDEVSALSPPLQAKLLRVLQDRAFTRLGGSSAIEIDIRIISSSNRPLDPLMASGEFRKDLFYRLNVFSVAIPPLRERRADILPLASRFLAEACRSTGRRLDGFDDEASELLTTHSWPGNVRELRNVVERAAILQDRGPRITAGSLPFDRFTAAEDFITTAAEENWNLEELESRYIREILRKTRSNYSKAATLLGINRKTLLEKRRRYRLD